MTEDPEPSHSGVPGVTRLGEDDWRAWRRLPTMNAWLCRGSRRAWSVY